MRISDWSSDVCSSDLPQPQAPLHHVHPPAGGRTEALDERQARDERRAAALREGLHHLYAHRLHRAVDPGGEGGPRAGGLPDRKSVVSGKSVSVRVDLGDRRIIKKKKIKNKKNL